MSNNYELDNFIIGNEEATEVPPLEFNLKKMDEYLKSTGKSFSELTEEEILNLK